MLLLCCSWRGLLLRLALLVVMVLLLLPLVCRQSLFTIFLLEHAQAPAVIFRVIRSRITC